MPTKRREGPLVSVVLTHYEEYDLLLLAILAAKRQTIPPYEIIVVDDGSEDQPRLRGVIQQARYMEPQGPGSPDLHLLTHPHQGRRTALTRAEGAEMALGDLLVFIDGDTLMERTCLSEYLKAYSANQDRALCGYVRCVGRMTILPEDIPSNWQAIFTQKLPLVDPQPTHSYILGKDPREAVGQLILFRDPAKVWEPPLSLMGANCAIPRSIYQASGGWNRSFVGRGQDGEFSIRIARAGHGFSYLDQARACHIAHEAGPRGGPSPHENLKRLYPEYYPSGSFVWVSSRFGPPED